MYFVCDGIIHGMFVVYFVCDGIIHGMFVVYFVVECGHICVYS